MAQIKITMKNYLVNNLIEIIRLLIYFRGRRWKFMSERSVKEVFSSVPGLKS